MGTFANEDVLYTNNPSPSTGTGLLQMRQNQKAIKELVGASAPVTLEIVDGSITPTSAFVLVDTEGQAAADDLTVINVVVDATNTLHDGMLLYLQAADAGRVVTVKNSSSANGIRTAGGGDITLVTEAWLVLQLRSGTWYELAVQPSGVLPIANGGTGSSTKNFVDLTSAQTVAGVKTLTANPVVKAATPVLTLQQTDITKGTNPSADQFAFLSIVDSAGTATANRTGLLTNSVNSAGLTSTILHAFQFANGSTANAQLGVYCSADGNTKYATAPTPNAGDNSAKIATTAWVNANVFGLKTGDFLFTNRASVDGFLVCTGAAVSRTTYAALFALIGTIYGAGDGSTTFNLPDMRARFLEGCYVSAGIVKMEAGLPDHTHTYTEWTGAQVFRQSSEINGGRGTKTSNTSPASASNSIYGNSTTVQPASYRVYCHIKY